VSETHCPESPDGKHVWRRYERKIIRCIACERLEKVK
jgi:hypothetical protein